MKTVYLIDGMFECHKCFAAYRELATKTGTPTGVIYGVLRGLASYRKTFGPGKIIFCWEGVPKRRIALDENYKAGREPLDSSFLAQVNRLRELLTDMGIEQVSSPDWEADDVLASLATEHATMGHKVVIVTGDDDLLQMVRPGIEGDTGPITVYNPRYKIAYDVQAVREKYHANPEDLIYQWAVEGDPSDNIPAATSDRKEKEMLLEAAKLAPSSIDGLASLSSEARGQFRKNVELIRLQVDVDNIVPIVPMRDTAKMRQTFQELEFNSFLKEDKFPQWATFAD